MLRRLGHDEVPTVFAASDAAMKTHYEEKLAMLRAALVNGVLEGAPDEHEQLLFIRFVDELTPLHVRLLALLDDPAGWLVWGGETGDDCQSSPMLGGFVPAA